MRIAVPISMSALAVLLFATLALAGPLEEGEAAWKRGDYAAALTLLEPLAERGNAEAQATLGIMYDNGQGVEMDHVLAVAWYTKAAAQGYAHAEYDLGLKYSAGQGVPQDDASAVFWFRRAADHGDPEAMYRLGNAYELGKGAPMDFVQAYAWYDRAVSHFPPDWTVSRDRAVADRAAIAARLTPEQLQSAQQSARAWKPK